MTIMSLCMLFAMINSVSAQPEELHKPGPASPWPQASQTAPFINAADYNPPVCSSELMKTEDFHQNPDATDALQAALDAGKSSVVYIPAGVYRVTRPLIVQTGTTVMGAGYCATILSSEKPLHAILYLKNVSGPMTNVRDLWVCGPVGGNWGATGIWVDGSNGVTIRDCWISALQYGIKVNDSSDIWLRNLVTELNHNGIFINYGELFWACSNLRMLDCYGYQNYFTNFTVNNCRGVQMSDCSATGSATAAQLTGCAQVTVRGFQVNWDKSPWRKFGLRFENCQHLTLADNVVEGMLEYGLALVKCKNFTASGNVLRNTTDGPAMMVQGCELGTVTGSNISESTQDGLIVTDSKDMIFSSNIINTFGQKPLEGTPSVGLRVDENSASCKFSTNIIQTDNIQTGWQMPAGMTP